MDTVAHILALVNHVPIVLTVSSTVVIILAHSQCTWLSIDRLNKMYINLDSMSFIKYSWDINDYSWDAADCSFWLVIVGHR